MNEVSSTKGSTRTVRIVRRITLLIVFVAAGLLLAGCFGGGKDRKAALTTGTTETGPAGTTEKDLSKAPPPNQQPERITTASDQCPHVNAAWVFQPQTFEETRNKAKDVVEAEVVAVEEGEPLGTPNPNEPGDSELIPTQKVTLRVTKGHKGPKQAGETIELFQTGSSCYKVEHDPVYKEGEQYVLMLDEGPKGMLKTVSPEGRMKKNADGTLETYVDDKATSKVKGKKLKDIEPVLEGGKFP
jgi:hypothetical protein